MMGYPAEIEKTYNQCPVVKSGPMDAFSWTCPHCGQPTTMTDSDARSEYVDYCLKSAEGDTCIRVIAYRCPSPECNKLTIICQWRKVQSRLMDGSIQHTLDGIHWCLVPESRAKVLPDYIPAAIIADYTEACRICELSPKASATLSRRCLQGMIRGFFGVTKRTLKDEIEAIQEKIDPLTWQAIDGVRSIGNIGAHMEKDIDLIVDVDPNEATKLIELIELLIDDWYVNQHKREEKLKAVIKVKEDKAAVKAAAKS